MSQVGRAAAHGHAYGGEGPLQAAEAERRSEGRGGREQSAARRQQCTSRVSEGSAASPGRPPPPPAAASPAGSQAAAVTRVVCVNAICTLGTDERLEGYLANVLDVLPDVSFVHVTELDGVRQSVREIDIPGWTAFRWWPGEGSRAMCWLVRSAMAQHVLRVRGLGRCHSLVLRAGADSQAVHLVGHHAPHSEDELQAHLSDLAVLLRSVRRCRRWYVVGDANAEELLAPGAPGVRDGRMLTLRREVPMFGVLTCFRDAGVRRGAHGRVRCGRVCACHGAGRRQESNGPLLAPRGPTRGCLERASLPNHRASTSQCAPRVLARIRTSAGRWRPGITRL